jgi:hypothetical protein
MQTKRFCARKHTHKKTFTELILQFTLRLHHNDFAMPKTNKEKNLFAVALSKLGASKGGKARAAKLSAERRSEIAQQASLMRTKKLSARRRTEIARNAVAARWAKNK